MNENNYFSSVLFVFVSAGHNIVYEFTRNIIFALRKHRSALADTKRGCLTANSVVLCTNDVMAKAINDVILRINDVTPYGVNDVMANAVNTWAYALAPQLF